MLSAGIDCGTRSLKVALVADGRLLATDLAPSGLDLERLAEEALVRACRQAGLERWPDQLFATGAWREAIALARGRVTEISAAARAARALRPEARTVIDAGAEEVRVLRLSAAGRLIDFALNDKCAASTGMFVEIMARALELELDQVGPLSLQASGGLTLNAPCVVFAESEMISLIHRQLPRAEIVCAVHQALAERVASLVRRVGLEPPVLLAGGLGLDAGFVRALQKKLGTDILLPDRPQHVGALGAALLAADQLAEGERA